MSPSFEWMSAEDAGHLAVAVRLYRQRARSLGVAVPAAFAQYEAELASRAMRCQDATPLADLWSVTQSGLVPTPPRLLTVQQAADAMTMSARTVWRRIADGTLPSVKIRGLTRIRVEDLDAFVNQLGGVAC